MAKQTASAQHAPAQAVVESPVAGVTVAEDWAGFEGAGFEGMDGSDFAVPFIQILQQLSPQLQENPDLRAGMVINTVTNEVWPATTGIVFVPCATQHVFVEWKPREAGGGFVATHAVDSEIVTKAKSEATKFGKYLVGANELIESFNVFGVRIGEDGVIENCVLVFTSSKIKKYRGWMTKAKMIQLHLPNGRTICAPLFAHRYRLRTVSEKNAKGVFFNWDIAFDGDDAATARLSTDSSVFKQAVEFAKMYQSGDVKGNYSKQQGEVPEAAAGADPGAHAAF